MSSSENAIDSMWQELVRMANEQFDSLAFRRLLATKFTQKRAQEYSIQMAHYVKNRRDCWGYVQGSAPLDGKKLIWEHEEDELSGKKSDGKQDQEKQNDQGLYSAHNNSLLRLLLGIL